MEVIEAIHGRRSIRSFESRPIARELIESIIWDAAQAPPPFAGEVPWSFNVYEGAERIAAYGVRAKAYARKNRPAGPGWDWTERPDFEVFWGAPVLIIVSGRREDCCRAGQNLMLSAHARGLGTCWVGSPNLWLADPATTNELGIPEGEPISTFCLGYPKSIPQTQPRERPRIVWA